MTRHTLSQYGDVHYYNYAADCQDPSTYPEARFVSEHGFQSFPSLSSYMSVTDKADRDMSSDLMDYRQRHGNGNAEVLAMMSRHFPVPGKSRPGDADSFEMYVWMTQVQQGRCYETAINQWRRLWSDATVRTAGVLSGN